MIEYILFFPHELGIELYFALSERPVRLYFPPVNVPYLSYKGPYKPWEPINVHIIEPIFETKPSKLVEWVNYYNAGEPKMGHPPAGYKKNIQLTRVDASKNELEKWTLIGSYLEFNKKELINTPNNLQFKLFFDRAFIG